MRFYPSQLSEKHQRTQIEGSGIAPEIAAERGYWTAARRSELPPEFIKDYQRRPGLVIPVRSPSGRTGYRLRADRPRKGKDGKPRKYEQPADTPNMLDVHPRNMAALEDTSVDLWVTEGEKKGDALTSRGLCAVALFGVWGWCVAGTKGRELLACWDHIALEGRRAYIVFDADVTTKENVQLALERLVAALEARGAEVLVVYLPGPEKGVDDYFVAGGMPVELKLLARKFEPQDLGRIRLSRDEKLRALVEDLERRFWSEEWKGMGGHSARDVALKLIEAAKRCGKVTEDGIRVVKAQGALAVEAKVSTRTLWKALNRLEEWGFAYRDNEGRKPDKSGAFVLRASVSHKGEGQGHAGKEAQESRVSDPGDLHLRAPRLRWSRPKYTPKLGTVRGTRKVRQGQKPEPRDRIERLGKIRGAILDVLDVAGGTATLQEIADALHRKRPRDIRRRNLPMLEEAGILTVEGDTVVLSDNWLDRLQEARTLGQEIEADEVARKRYKEKSRGYHNRHRTEVSRHPVNARVPGDAWIEELEKLPEPPSKDVLYRMMHQGIPVGTPRGSGRLWQVFSDQVGVVVDSEPDRVSFFVPDELTLEAA